MKLQTKLVFDLSLPFLGFFVLGVTDVGGESIDGQASPNVDHWKADDVYMGAALAPWVYSLVSFLLLCRMAHNPTERRDLTFNWAE